MTLSPEAAQQACDHLFALWQRGEACDNLPPAIRPDSRAEGYAVQARIMERSAFPLFGWKVAATSVAGQAHIGVDGPLAGRILAERVIDNGGTCRLGANRMKVAELEFAFRMAVDLLPRREPYEVDEVLGMVASLHPAIEIPDSRYTAFETVGAPQLIADNACAHMFLLGQAAPDRWRDIDLSCHVVWGLLNDSAPAEGSGANVLGDPRIALAWLVNELSALDVPISAGQVITTGTCLPPIDVVAGDHVRGDFGKLGSVSITFSE